MPALRFLIIDDNPGDRELAMRALRRDFPDAEFTSIITAEAFAQALEEGQFDVVITDYQFLWSDGLKLLNDVKARYPDIPVIMFTASGSQEIAVEAMKQGLDDYVIKSPRHIERLNVAVRSALERVEQRRLFAELQEERLHLLAATQAAERRARFLADATARLGATLDYRATLRVLAELLTTDLADWCFIDVPGRDGRMRRLASARRDPGLAERVAGVEQLVPLGIIPIDQIPDVLQHGRTVFVPRVPPEYVETITDDAQQRALLQQMNIVSVMAVALRAREQTLGVITLLSSRPERPFTSEDLELIEELAWRASLSVDNARLYTAEQRERQRTEQLQAITMGLVETATAADVARVLTEQGMKSLNALGSAYFSLTDDGSALIQISSAGFQPSYANPNLTIPLDDSSLVTDVMRTGSMIVIESWQEWAVRYPNMAAQLTEAPQWQTFVAVPLIIDDTPFGVLILAFADVQEFDAQDRALLQTIARQGTIALGRVRLYEAEQSARAEAEAAVRLRDQFFSVASHELRTPLTSLLGNAELLYRRVVRDGELSERNQRSMNAIVTQARRLSRMINALLDLSRLQNGQLALDRAPLDLRVVIQQVLDEAHSLITSRSLEYAMPEAPVEIFGDEVRLAQVIYNLVDNAVKYSPNGGVIRVELTKEGTFARIDVADQGIGVPPEALPHLFQRFFRASNINPRHMSGMGVGLYVVKEIVTLHGGTVSVASDEGKGSTFTVRLPLLIANEASETMQAVS